MWNGKTLITVEFSLLFHIEGVKSQVGVLTSAFPKSYIGTDTDFDPNVAPFACIVITYCQEEVNSVPMALAHGCAQTGGVCP